MIFFLFIWKFVLIRINILLKFISSRKKVNNMLVNKVESRAKPFKLW